MRSNTDFDSRRENGDEKNCANRITVAIYHIRCQFKVREHCPIIKAAEEL